MADLTLPEEVAESFDAVSPLIARHVGGKARFYLGFDTAIAVRWRHRDCFDLDIALDYDDYDGLWQGRERFREDPGLCGVARAIWIGSTGFLVFLANGSEVRIRNRFRFTRPSVSEDTAHGGRLLLETPLETLLKKFEWGIHGNTRITYRDLYDVAVTRRKDPDAFQQAVAYWKPNRLRALVVELRCLAPAWRRRGCSPVPGAVFAREAKHAPRIVLNELERELRDR